MIRAPLFDTGGKKKPRAYVYMVTPLIAIGAYLYLDNPFPLILYGLFVFVVGAFDYEAMGLGGPFGIKRPGPEKPWQD